jgi:hypothetical protein
MAAALAVLAAAEYVGATVVAGPFTDPANGHSYTVVGAGDWNAAEAEAQALGGNLATIRSASENSWITSNICVDLSAEGGPNLSDVPLWIGLYDPSPDDGTGSTHAADFVWIDGEAVSYTNWNPGEPNNGLGDENYGVINWHFAADNTAAVGTWNDVPESGEFASGNTTPPYYGIAEIIPEPRIAEVLGLILLGSRARRTSNGPAERMGNTSASRLSLPDGSKSYAPEVDPLLLVMRIPITAFCVCFAAARKRCWRGCRLGAPS